MQREEYCSIGTLQKTYGVKGSFFVRFDSNSSEKYKKMELVFIEIDKQPVPFFISEYIVKSDNSAIVDFEGVDSEKKAKEFLGSHVLILKKATLKAETRQEEKLISYQVFDADKNFIGVIHDVVDFVSHQVFQVFQDNKEILIPANDELIIGVDEKRKIIIMDIPEGLLDLYI